jgi:hypothetical protein
MTGEEAGAFARKDKTDNKKRTDVEDPKSPEDPAHCLGHIDTGIFHLSRCRCCDLDVAHGESGVDEDVPDREKSPS